MVPRFVVLVLVTAAGCARPTLFVGLPAPNPNACYVTVYERPEFRGIGDVLNGPGRWPTLEGLRQTNEENWRNRIRSLRMGSAATLTVYTDASFKGESQRFGPESDHPRLDERLSGRIESLELTCQQQTAPTSLAR